MALAPAPAPADEFCRILFDSEDKMRLFCGRLIARDFIAISPAGTKDVVTGMQKRFTYLLQLWLRYPRVTSPRVAFGYLFLWDAARAADADIDNPETAFTPPQYAPEVYPLLMLPFDESAHLIESVIPRAFKHCARGMMCEEFMDTCFTDEALFARWLPPPLLFVWCTYVLGEALVKAFNYRNAALLARDMALSVLQGGMDMPEFFAGAGAAPSLCPVPEGIERLRVRTWKEAYDILMKWG